MRKVKLVRGYTTFTEKEEKALKDWFKALTPDKKENLIKRLGIRGAIAMSRELSKWKAGEDITISSDIEATIPPVLTPPPSPTVMPLSDHYDGGAGVGGPTVLT